MNNKLKKLFIIIIALGLVLNSFSFDAFAVENEQKIEQIETEEEPPSNNGENEADPEQYETDSESDPEDEPDPEPDPEPEVDPEPAIGIIIVRFVDENGVEISEAITSEYNL